MTKRRSASALAIAVLLGWAGLAHAQQRDEQARPTSPSLAERTGVNALLDRAPAAADLLLAIYRFDQFQSAAADTTGLRGDDAARRFSAAQVKAAEARNTQVAALNRQASLNITFADDAPQGVDNRVGGLEGSVGPTYLKTYYEAQAREHDSLLGTLRRYLDTPDNDAVRAFAQKLVPEIERSLAQVRLALDRPPG